MASRCSGISCLIALGLLAQSGWSDFLEHRAAVGFSAHPSLDRSIPGFFTDQAVSSHETADGTSVVFASGETTDRGGRLLIWSVVDEFNSIGGSGTAATTSQFVDRGLPPPGNRGGGREIAPVGPFAGIFPVTIEPGFSQPAVPSLTPTVVPSPGSALLGVLGLAAAVSARRRA